MTHRPPALLFGIPIDDLTMETAVERVTDLVALGRRTGRTHQIATVNLDFVVNALEHDDVHGLLQRCDVCLADGMPIVWASRAFDMPVQERIAGADLVPRLFAESEASGLRIHVFGSQPDVASRARDLIDRTWPGSNVTIDPGPMIPDVRVVDDVVIEAIAAADADIVCVALGNPKQEFFIDAHRDRIGAPVMIGVGGSLDLLVGERRRAPAWMQRFGLEWIARAVQEPGRLGRRYAHDIRAMGPRMFREFRAHRRRLGHGALDIEIDDDVVARISNPSDTDVDRYGEAARLLLDGARLLIRPDGRARLADRSAARLVGLVRLARTAGSAPAWDDDPSPALLDSLGRLGVPQSFLTE